MSFVTLKGFSRQHFLRTHHVTGANKKAWDIERREEYKGDVHQSHWRSSFCNLSEVLRFGDFLVSTWNYRRYSYNWCNQLMKADRRIESIITSYRRCAYKWCNQPMKADWLIEFIGLAIGGVPISDAIG